MEIDIPVPSFDPKDSLWDNVKSLLYAILLAVLIRTVWLQPFHIPSGSMIPTLLIGDNIFVSKTAYGYSRYSIPFGGTINYFSGRIWSAEPKLGEVAVFRSVVEPDTDFKAAKFIETLPNGVKHSIIMQVPFGEGTYDNTPVYEVPAGHFFMMGDNRHGSNDSRAQGVVGYIPLENFVGRASFIFFSTGGHIALWEIWKWPLTAHYSRIGQGIH
jgi:signal peptidase I